MQDVFIGLNKTTIREWSLIQYCKPIIVPLLRQGKSNGEPYNFNRFLIMNWINTHKLVKPIASKNVCESRRWDYIQQYQHYQFRHRCYCTAWYRYRCLLPHQNIFIFHDQLGSCLYVVIQCGGIVQVVGQ